MHHNYSQEAPSMSAYGGTDAEIANMIPIIAKQVKRVSIAPEYSGLKLDPNMPDAVKRNEKQLVIGKLRSQNEKLKTELKMLTDKLKSFIEKSRQRKHK